MTDEITTVEVAPVPVVASPHKTALIRFIKYLKAEIAKLEAEF